MGDRVSRKSIPLPVVEKHKVTTMNKLDFNNHLYYLLMDHADVASETDGQRLAGCSVDQMFDDMFDKQELVEPMMMTTRRGTNNAK